MNTLELFTVTQEHVPICWLDNVIQHCTSISTTLPLTTPITNVPVPAGLVLYTFGILSLLTIKGITNG